MYKSIGQSEECLGVEKWPRDVANRQSLADEIMAFLRAQNIPITIAIDGRWGSGKTYFLNGFTKMIEEAPKEGGAAGLCVNLNAWESDLLNDPLLYLYYGLAAAVDRMPQYDAIDGESVAILKKNITDIGVELLGAVTGGLFSNLFRSFERNCEDHPVAQYKKAIASGDACQGNLRFAGDPGRISACVV